MNSKGSRGQSTLEYILLLAAVLAAVIVAVNGRKLSRHTKVAGARGSSSKITNGASNPAGVARLSLGGGAQLDS